MVGAPKIVVAGHLTLDELMEVDGVRLAPGGAALYTSLAASAMGAEVKLYSKVGGDYPGEYLELLREAGVDTGGVKVLASAWTTRYRIDYSGEVRRLILAARAPNLSLREVGECDCLYLGPVAWELDEAEVSWASGRFRTVLDPQGLLRSIRPDGMVALTRSLPETCLKELWMLRLSEEEAEAMTRETEPRKAAEKLLGKGAEVVALSMGARGLVALSKAGGYLVPAYPVAKVVDPTGAGDILGGAMATELLRSGELGWAALVGVAAASIGIEGQGPKPLLSKNFRSIVQERALQLMEHIKRL